jgi:hypothetical protein
LAAPLEKFPFQTGEFCTNRVRAVKIDDGLLFSEFCSLNKGFQGEWFYRYSTVGNFGYINMPNTKTDRDCVMARSAATRQSMRRFRLSLRRGHPQGRLDCHGASPFAMTMDLIQVFSKLLTAE